MSHLDITAIGLQIILPLSLIAWLALAPMKSRLGFSSMRFQPASSSPVLFWLPPGQATGPPILQLEIVRNLRILR